MHIPKPKPVAFYTPKPKPAAFYTFLVCTFIHSVLFKSNCQYDHLLICVINFRIKTNIKQGKSIIIHIYVRSFLLISLFIDIDTNKFEINIIFLFLSNLSDHKRYEKDYLLLYTINKKKHYLLKLIGLLNLGLILYLHIHIFKVNYL